MRIEAAGSDAQPANRWVHGRVVQSNFIETIGIPLLQGRNLGSSDTRGSPQVALISEAMARRFFPNVNPIGRRFTVLGQEWLPSAREIEVVGVVKDVQVGAEWDNRAAVYLSNRQVPSRSSHFIIRSAGDPMALAPAIEDAVREIDPNLPLTAIRTQNQERDRGGSRARTLLPVWSAFGAVALLLTSIGLYGLMSYTVARRTSEIGLRMALGARRLDVVGLMMRQMFQLVSIGIGIGLALSLVANETIRVSLFGVTLFDLPTIAAVIALLLIITILAGYQPLRRASRIDPTIALRCE